jgi:hypothetical protein
MSTLVADQPPPAKRSRNVNLTETEKENKKPPVVDDAFTYVAQSTLVADQPPPAKTETEKENKKPPVVDDAFTYVAQSTIPGAGWGLFAKKKLRKNLNLGYYKGKVYRRYPSWTRMHKHRNFVYFMELDRRPPWIEKTVWSAKKNKYVYVDGTSIHSFANCCKGDEDIWNCDVRGTGAFVTNKGVEKDEEIFISYGDDYWDSDLHGGGDEEEREEEAEEEGEEESGEEREEGE